MDFFAAIDQRHCVREFSQRVPDDALIDSLLDAAIRAPSAGNLQPWHFYVVRDAAVRERLSAAARSQPHVAAAPVVIVLCADPELSAVRYGKRGRKLYCIQDVAAAAENLFLAAAASGAAGCWVGAFDEGEVARIVSAPRRRRPLVMIPIGYEAQPPESVKSRRPREEVTTRIG